MDGGKHAEEHIEQQIKTLSDIHIHTLRERFCRTSKISGGRQGSLVRPDTFTFMHTCLLFYLAKIAETLAATPRYARRCSPLWQAAQETERFTTC